MFFVLIQVMWLKPGYLYVFQCCGSRWNPFCNVWQWPSVGRAKPSHYCMVRQLHSLLSSSDTWRRQGPELLLCKEFPLSQGSIDHILARKERGLLHLCCLSDFCWCSGLGWEMGSYLTTAKQWPTFWLSTRLPVTPCKQTQRGRHYS